MLKKIFFACQISLLIIVMSYDVSDWCIIKNNVEPLHLV